MRVRLRAPGRASTATNASLRAGIQRLLLAEPTAEMIEATKGGLLKVPGMVEAERLKDEGRSAFASDAS